MGICTHEGHLDLGGGGESRATDSITGCALFNSGLEDLEKETFTVWG